MTSEGDVSAEQLREAAITAIRNEIARATNRHTEPNWVIDLPSEDTAGTLSEWAIEAGSSPQASAANRHYLPVGLYSEARGVDVSGAWLDLESAHPGAIIWRISSLEINGVRYAVLEGAVRLHFGSWRIFRYRLTSEGLDVWFAPDERWYDNRRRHTREQ